VTKQTTSLCGGRKEEVCQNAEQLRIEADSGLPPATIYLNYDRAGLLVPGFLSLHLDVGQDSYPFRLLHEQPSVALVCSLARAKVQ
jgi:hypothetical protein